MHEASLIKGLIRHVEEVVRAENAERAVALEVTLGALSHLSPEHFREHFDRETGGSIVEGARLTVHTCDDETDAHANGIFIHNVEVTD